MKRFRKMTVSLLLAAVLLVNAPVLGMQAAANPAVLPPSATVQGMTLGEWGAEYFRAAFAIPAPQNPSLGNPWPTCYVDRVGNVGVGVGYFFSGESNCEMPAGMMLYVLVVGTECSSAEPPPFYGGNEEELRACVLDFTFENLSASVDDCVNLKYCLSLGG